MSHFSVLVPADDEQHLAEVLEPYMENCNSTPPLQFMEFYDKEDELREKAKEVITADSYTGERNPEATGQTMLQFYGKGDFEVFADKWAGLDKDPLMGRYGYWQNPDARWDWFSIGGRWTGYLRLRRPATVKELAEGLVGFGHPGILTLPCSDPFHCDWAPVSWIDWEGIRSGNFEESLKTFRTVKKCQAEVKGVDVEPFFDEFWNAFLKWLEEHDDEESSIEEYARNRLLHEALGREKIFFWNENDCELFLDLSEEEFIAKQKAQALTFAFVDLEGNWVERGKMGYWAIVSDPNEGYDEAFWKFARDLREENPSQRVYMVDCHI